MPCVTVKLKGSRYPVHINFAPPSEFVTMTNGKRLELEWHEYFGPGVVMKRGTGVRMLTNAEFRDPNVDAWIISHGGMSCRENEVTVEDHLRKK